MANWWEAAPLAEAQPSAGANWWEAAPLAEEPKPAPVAPIGKPVVPFYVSGQGGEVNVNATPEIRAQFDAQQQAEQEAKAKEQAAFDATRTLPTRVRDAATFAASVPIRAATRGEYGIGDAFGLVSDAAGQNAKQSEQDFARANETGLEYAAAAGDVMAGVPVLNTMGAVPGQVLRTGAAATRQLPGEVRRVLRDESGAGPVYGGSNAGPNVSKGPFVQPGGGAGGGSSPPPQPPAPPPPGGGGKGPMPPTRDDVIAAGERQGVTVPRMIAGSETQKDVAAALAGIPYSGAPVKMAYDKGLQQLSAARDAAGDVLGAPGVERAGMGAKQGILDWVRKTSDDYLKGKYDEVYSGVSPDVTRPLSATRSVVQQLQKQMQASTSKSAAPAINLLEEALARPEGLSAKGLAELRSDIGRRIDAAKVVPDASEAAYKRLYPALTADLQETIKAAGGPKALQAWNTANREAKIVAIKRKRLAQVVGSNEEALSAEKVLERINSLATAKGGNLRNLRLTKEVIGDKDWGNVGSELVSRLGVNPKNGQFSADRFLTAYGKMGEDGKSLVFGSAKSALDDIAILSRKFHDLDSRFNKSNTGKVTAMLKLLNNPYAATANLATAFVNPVSAFTLGGQFGGMAAGRRVAWALAQPATAKKASSLLKAYYGAESVAQITGKLAAKNEQALAASIRAYATEIARQSGGNADEINASLSEHIKNIRNGGSQ